MLNEKRHFLRITYPFVLPFHVKVMQREVLGALYAVSQLLDAV